MQKNPLSKAIITCATNNPADAGLIHCVFGVDEPAIAAIY